MTVSSPSIDPTRDLVLERTVDVPPAQVWAAWTDPELLKVWFCPAPWRVSECAIDLRPGGRFFTRMCGPDGEDVPNEGTYLEVGPGYRLVFTDALAAGYRPTGASFMTAIITIEPDGAGTRYTATVLHADAASRQKHADMGFHHGWGAALDQLVAMCKTGATG